MPPLDLSKVKGYEDHVREKLAQKAKEKMQHSYSKQPQEGSVALKKQPSTSQAYDKLGGVPQKQQMQTIQHHSTKVNNFVGGEIDLSNMNTLVAKHSKNTKNDAQTIEH